MTPPVITYKGTTITATPVSVNTLEAAAHRIGRWNALLPESATSRMMEFASLVSLLGEDIEGQLVAMNDEDLAAALTDYRTSVGLNEYDAMTSFVMSPLIDGGDNQGVLS